MSKNQPPQHKNPTSPARTALAPYNFVPITDRVVAFPEVKNPLAVPHDRYDARRYSGWIDVELETKTPIYVRAPLELDEFAQVEAGKQNKRKIDDLANKPDFFYTAQSKQPVIPGSSLRGMLRSIVEIVAHSKMGAVTDTPLIYRAVGDTTSHGEAYRDQLFSSDPHKKHHYTPRFKGGYIRKTRDGWAIQPAQTINETTFARVNQRKIPRGLKKWHKSRNAQTLYVKVGKYEYKKVRGGFIHVKRATIIDAAGNAATGFVKAALARSGRMFSKKTELVVFPLNESADLIRIPDGTINDEPDLVNAYREQISPEQQKLLGGNGVLVDMQPIMYLMEGNKLVFFGHTQMFRIPYPRSPRQMLPPAHRDERLVDLTENMFGRVKRQRGGEEQAIAGRVFVEDARLAQQGQDVWLKGGNAVVIPKILASPKPTTFQHYLTQNYPDSSGRNSRMASYNTSPRRTTLRGHKLYWHKGKVQRADFEAHPRDIKGKETQYTRMKPVREGITFRFRVRFENLAAVELGALWWAIALPAQGEFVHKIGMGKPLGLGGVKLTPTLTLFDPVQRYSQLFAGDDQFKLGTVSPSICQKVAADSQTLFEKFICGKLGYRSFTSSERIQMLLAMLRWPGPNPRDTRYMEIERPKDKVRRGARNTRNRPKVNEYADRPVLPTPLQAQEF